MPAALAKAYDSAKKSFRKPQEGRPYERPRRISEILAEIGVWLSYPNGPSGALFGASGPGRKDLCSALLDLTGSPWRFKLAGKMGTAGEGGHAAACGLMVNMGISGSV